MRVWLALLLVLLCLSPLRAEETEDPGEKHLPVETYYNQEFFSEPWRLPNAAIVVLREAGAVLLINVGLFGVLRKWRRSA